MYVMNRFFESYSDSDSDTQQIEEGSESSEELDQSRHKSREDQGHSDQPVTKFRKLDKPGTAKDVDLKLKNCFEELRERNRLIAEKASKKRARKLKKEILGKMKSRCSEEDRRRILEGDIDEDDALDVCGSSISVPQIVPVPSTSSAPKWEELKPHLSQFDHLTADKSKPLKSGVEKKVDLAISLGEYELAEKMSDHLANRDFAQKIANAFDAKKYVEEKQQKEATKRKKKKKKKLTWTFENKPRWETKSNM